MNELHYQVDLLKAIESEAFGKGENVPSDVSDNRRCIPLFFL